MEFLALEPLLGAFAFTLFIAVWAFLLWDASPWVADDSAYMLFRLAASLVLLDLHSRRLVCLLAYALW